MEVERLAKSGKQPVSGYNKFMFIALLPFSYIER